MEAGLPARREGPPRPLGQRPGRGGAGARCPHAAGLPPCPAPLDSLGPPGSSGWRRAPALDRSPARPPPPAGFLEGHAAELAALAAATLGAYHDRASQRAVEGVLEKALGSEAFLKHLTAVVVKAEAGRPGKQVRGGRGRGGGCRGRQAQRADGPGSAPWIQRGGVRQYEARASLRSTC